jgi:hypothetical protein
LVEKHGGEHHGYFLPSEGANDQAIALFSFESFAAYERYRGLFGKDEEFIRADRIRDASGCILRYDRTFMRPLLPRDVNGPPEALRPEPQRTEASTYAPPAVNGNHGDEGAGS